MADSAQTDTMSTGSLFSYDSVPLSNPSTEIRLLEVHPASSYTDDLYCRIYTAPISQPPSYIALSYAWGANTKTHDISVVNPVNEGGASTHGTGGSSLPLTSSLDICLRHLRELCHRGKVESKPLWIDQICINQDDNDEKSFQVMLMKDVYSSAHQVIVWLGPAADDSDKVMDAFTHVGQRFHEIIGVPYSDEHLRSGSDLLDEKWKTEQSCVIAFVKEACEVFLALEEEGKCWMKRSWFTRLWTIQEFCLCQDTMFACGYKVLPERLVSAAHAFMDSYKILKGLRMLWSQNVGLSSIELLVTCKRLVSISKRREYLQYLHQKETLNRLLWALIAGSAEFYVTDERDKVYGLLGLAGDADELGIWPDYSPSMTYARVLTQTASAMIKRYWRIRMAGGLGIFRYAIAAKSKSNTQNETEIPSWVPEWKVEGSKGLMYPNGISSSACGNFNTPDLVPTSSPTILGVRGFCVDTVVELGDKVPPPAWWADLDGPKQILRFFDSLKRLLNTSKQNSYTKNIYTTPIHHDAALWRVPVANQWMKTGDMLALERADSNLESLGRQFIAHWEDWAVREEEWKEYIASINSGEDHSGLVSHLDGLLVGRYFMPVLTMEGKRPYLTKKGYLGLGPGRSQPGDKVIVFHGETIPYLVRPVPERGDNMYLLIGEAYCDGIMDGELADTAEREVFYLV